MGIIFETFKIMKIGEKKSEMSHRFLRCFHVCLFVLVLDVTTLSAQDLSRKEMRQAEKRQQAQADSLAYTQGLEALKQGRFVVEVDRMLFKRGKTANVSPITNFISRDGSDAVLQLTSNSVQPGPNGIGGITLRGTVSDIELKTDRKGIVHYDMRVLGGGIAAEVSITLAPGSSRVHVEVNPDFNNYDIIMDGRIVPYDNSSVFRGRVY